jgi:uncharacterized protein (TIGR02646 family)
MRPVNRGDWPKDGQEQSKIYHPYGSAANDLIKRVGTYCSYCERKQTNPAIEHILPKTTYPKFIENWHNFLLACPNCNSTKSKQDSTLVYYYWPDCDNTAYIFEYKEGGVVEINPNLNEEQKKKAQDTLRFTGLDRRPGHPKFSKKDKRWNDRLEVWDIAIEQLDDLEAKKIMPKTVVTMAKSHGFWSVWMTVFREHSEVLNMLIDAFPGTDKDCFDEQGKPKMIINRFKPIISREPQPSYDSHIWDNEAESLLEEEEETSTELEAERPQPYSEFLPVDDSFRSEEKSGSLFTRLIDAFSGIRQDYIGDRDELLSLEDSETEPEDFLSEESAESESPDEPETETEAIDSEPEPEDSMETEAIDSEPEQPEPTFNRPPQPTQPYSIPKKPPQSLETENDRKDKPVVNPSLTQTPRYQIADVIPLQYETSILHWLERIGRLIDRTSDNDENLLSSEEEIAELIENDGKYDDDDDDDILVDDD